VLAEKGPQTGGSAEYAVFLWTAPSLEVMREVNPDGDPALGAELVAGHEQAIEWVRSLGVSVKPPVDLLGFGRGCETDMPRLLATCTQIVREAEGCEVLLGARTSSLTTRDGCVTGAEIVTKSGEVRTIHARSTVLATGGFGGDPDLRARFIHPRARDLPLRANPHSTGDGMRLGQSVGAALGKDNAGFYGHLVPSRIATKDPHGLREVSFFHSEHGVLLNLDGHRFVDETVGDHLNTLAVLEQPESRALFVADQRVHDEWMLKSYVEGIEPTDKFALAYRDGGRCAVADDLDEFEFMPEEWGYPGPAVRDALKEFNRQCERSRPSPSRARDAVALVDPPYYLTELVPAITFTFTGLLIDPEARVLDEHSTPIPGLLAAGADAGGLWCQAYAGGAAAALVFGLRAARTAVGP
jgi:succinate dehydrogenase/fumarate reductase flavoprotein subunit